ncbi:MAG: Wzz/FepE/Etk N-terminal domain-containing protein [Eubacteriales bacterium]|nr:Wzz/FepE/Etk N-terminal domain-containing protein [Eubacteriales bacterium]MDD4475002.1 Wzz/FepE/Etk N-terminal domain-containing protein [Eubacteriales bacterium]
MEITLEKLLEIIKKNIIFILIVGILFGAIAFIVTDFFITPTYEADVRLYVSSPYASTQPQPTIDVLRKMTQTYITILETHEFCKTVLENVDPAVASNYTPSSLKSAIKYSIVSNTEVFDITITGKNSSDLFAIAEVVASLAPERIKKYNPDANINVVEPPIKSEIEKPVAPSARNNTIIGVILGLAFSFGLVFLREILDVRIKNSDEIVARYKYPIIGRVPIFHGDIKNNRAN